MKQKKRFVAFAWGLCALAAAYAQSNEFDLSSQRLEVQWVNPAPGEKMDHHGLVVNPTPRYMKLTNEGTIDISGGVKLESPLPTLKEAWDYRGDIDFLVHTPKGFPLRLQFAKIPVIIEKGYEGSSVADGAYSLRITKKGISIMAANDLGLFYGIQTLRHGESGCGGWKEASLPRD